MALTTTPVGNLINDLMMVPAWVLPPEVPPTYTYSFNSGDKFINDNDPIRLLLDGAPLAVSDVTVTAKGFGDFAGNNKHFRVFYNFGIPFQQLLLGRLFVFSGTDCNAGLDEDTFVVSADDWNLYVGQSSTVVYLSASSAVNTAGCSFNGTINVTFEYEAETEIQVDGPAAHDIRSAHKTLVAGVAPTQPEIIQADMRFDHLTSSIVPVVVDRLGKTNIGGAAVCSIDMGDGTRVSFLGFPMKGETGGQVVIFTSAGSCAQH